MTRPWRLPLLNTRDRRLLCAGMATLAVALTFRATRLLTEQTETLRMLRAEQTMLLEQDELLLLLGDSMNALTKTSLHRRDSERRRRFRASDPLIAGMQAAEYVSRIMELTGFFADSPLDFESASGDGVLTAELSGSSDFPTAMLLIHRLESGPILLRLDNLTVETPGEDELNAAEVLRVAMRIQAFWIEGGR